MSYNNNGIHGLYFNGKKYEVQVWFNKKKYYLGSFISKDEAIKKYWEFKKEKANITPSHPIFENDIVKIPLSKNSPKKRYAIIDLEDYEKVKDYNWSLSGGYACNKNAKKMHRLILGFRADHKNGDKLDNRKENLRTATRSENVRNSKKPFHKRDYHKNSSIYKGVMKRNDYVAKWRARIRIEGKLIDLGTYDDEIEAAKAYDKKAIELFGEFACINFPVNNLRCAIDNHK